MKHLEKEQLQFILDSIADEHLHEYRFEIEFSAHFGKIRLIRIGAQSVAFSTDHLSEMICFVQGFLEGELNYSGFYEREVNNE